MPLNDHRPTAESSDKYRDGAELLNELLPGAIDVIEATYAPVAPAMTDFIVEFAFGAVATRSGLETRDRVIANLSALTTLGGAELQLRTQTAVAGRIGLTRTQIVEVILNASPIAGLARVQQALLAVADVLPPIDGDTDGC